MSFNVLGKVILTKVFNAIKKEGPKMVPPVRLMVVKVVGMVPPPLVVPPKK